MANSVKKLVKSNFSFLSLTKRVATFLGYICKKGVDRIDQYMRSAVSNSWGTS